MAKPFKIGDIVKGVELLALDEEKSTPKEKWWKYKCPNCGNIKSARSSRVGSLCQSCSAKQNREKRITSCISDDLTGKVFSYWKVLNKAPKANYWTCYCQNCGTIKDVFRGSLINGNSKSCGCVKSWGEQQIIYWLNYFNISYKKEITFNNLLGLGRNNLRFDFGIYDKNDKLICLIEYDGRQHDTFENNWNLSENEFNKLQIHDQLKNNYCINNNLNLLRLNKESNIREIIEQIALAEELK